jgi:hypothetical protein
VETAIRLTAKRQGSAAASIAGQPLEDLVTQNSMAWAAATALSRGFNLRRQEFDGEVNRCSCQLWRDATARHMLLTWRLPGLRATLQHLPPPACR